MKNINRFIIITILTGAFYSCGVRQGLNGTWVGGYGSLPYKSTYANHIPEYDDSTHIITIKPIVTRDTMSMNVRPLMSRAPREKYLTVSGRKLELSFSHVNMTDSPIMFRNKSLGKYKRRKGQIIATFDRIESVNTYDGSSQTVNREEFTLIFYYSKSTQTLHEIHDNDTTIIYSKNK